MDWIYSFVVTSILVLAFYAFYRRKLQHMHELSDHIPGIKNLPWKAMITQVFDKNKNSIYDFYNVIERIIEHFPHLSKAWVGPFLIIDIRNPDYIKKILYSDKCIDRAVFYSFPYKTGLLHSGGDLWKRHRKILNPAFSTNKLNRFLPIVNEKARKLTKVLNEKVDGDAFNIVRLLSALTLESLLRTSFELEKDFMNNPYSKIFAIVKKEASNIGYSIFNFLNLFFPTHHRENEFTKFCQDIYEESKKESKNVYNGGNLNFFEILLKNKNFLSKQEIQDEVSTMILAGNASTALSIASVFLMLAMHPKVQDKVVQEMNEVFHNDEEEIDNENINKLKYLDQVIKETMRLFPVAPVIGRKVSSDIQLDDNFTLPKCANVIIRIIDVQRNPALWGNDAKFFKPERFCPENICKVHPYAFIPFSNGPRNCIGYKYASNAMKVVLCHILRKFKVTTPLKYDELKLEISFILRIAQNYMVKLEIRGD